MLQFFLLFIVIFDNILFLKYRVSDQTNECECELEQTTYQYFEIWSLRHQGIKKQYIIKKNIINYLKQELHQNIIFG